MGHGRDHVGDPLVRVGQVDYVALRQPIELCDKLLAQLLQRGRIRIGGHRWFP